MLIDDQEIQHQKVEYYCSKLDYDFFGVREDFGRVNQLIEEYGPDVILQDINLNFDEDGISLAKGINENYNIPIIFTTSHKSPEMIKKASRANPSGYLVKPFEMHNLSAAVELAMINLKKQFTKKTKPDKSKGDKKPPKAFFIKSHDKIEKVLLEDILWVESAEEKYINIVAANKKLRMRSSLTKIMKQLPEKDFVRVNRNQIININHMDAIDEFEETVIVAGHDLLIGKVFKTRIIELINIIN